MWVALIESDNETPTSAIERPYVTGLAIASETFSPVSARALTTVRAIASVTEMPVSGSALARVSVSATESLTLRPVSEMGRVYVVPASALYITPAAAKFGVDEGTETPMTGPDVPDAVMYSNTMSGAAFLVLPANVPRLAPTGVAEASAACIANTSTTRSPDCVPDIPVAPASVVP